MDSLQVMKSVVVVAETSSFTAAAERLRTSTQMVSRHVRSFEERLEGRLFDRTTRRVRVTDLGKAVVDQCQRILDAVEELEASVQDRRHAPKGRIRIAAPLTFGELHVAPHIASFQRNWPNIEVSMLLTDRFVNPLEEGVEATVRIGRLDDSSLVARKLAETELLCVASPGYLGEAGRPETPDRLSAHRIIHDDNLRGGVRWSFSREGREHRVPVKPNISVNSARAVQQLARAGAGVALVPRFAVIEALRDGKLVRVLEGYETQTFPIHLLFPHAHLLTARVKRFADHLSNSLSETPL